jgi:formylmethanofuran dehydrogenase subunit D
VLLLKKLDVILVSGRTTEQGIGLEEGKTSERYVKSVQHIQINPVDAEKLGLRKSDVIDVFTEAGSISVYWKAEKNLDRGLVFFPYGLWANQLYNSITDGTGMPSFKGTEATLTRSSNSKATSVEEIIQRLRGKS